MRSDPPITGRWYSDGYSCVQVTEVTGTQVKYHVEGNPDQTWQCYHWVWDEYGMVMEKDDQNT